MVLGNKQISQEGSSPEPLEVNMAAALTVMSSDPPRSQHTFHTGAASRQCSPFSIAQFVLKEKVIAKFVGIRPCPSCPAKIRSIVIRTCPEGVSPIPTPVPRTTHRTVSCLPSGCSRSCIVINTCSTRPKAALGPHDSSNTTDLCSSKSACPRVGGLQ